MQVITFCPKDKQAELKERVPGGGWDAALCLENSGETIGYWSSWRNGPWLELQAIVGPRNIWVDAKPEEVLNDLSERFGAKVTPVIEG